MDIGIYCIENKSDLKKYIGQSINLEDRMYAYHGGFAIDEAIKKYGKEYFKYYILLYCELNELEYYEKSCIIMFHSHVSEWGYNISWGGGAPMGGRKHTDEAKKKIGDGNRGKTVSDETKNILRICNTGENNPSFGKHRSKKTRERMSIAHMNPSEESQKARREKLSGINGPSFGTKKSNATSKYHGVYILRYKKSKTRWSAQLSISGKQITIKSFKNLHTRLSGSDTSICQRHAHLLFVFLFTRAIGCGP